MTSRSGGRIGDGPSGDGSLGDGSLGGGSRGDGPGGDGPRRGSVKRGGSGLRPRVHAGRCWPSGAVRAWSAATAFRPVHRQDGSGFPSSVIAPRFFCSRLQTVITAMPSREISGSVGLPSGMVCEQLPERRGVDALDAHLAGVDRAVRRVVGLRHGFHLVATLDRSLDRLGLGQSLTLLFGGVLRIVSGVVKARTPAAASRRWPFRCRFRAWPAT